jgi:flagellar motility protein MotE (MotC chaperone)
MIMRLLKSPLIAAIIGVIAYVVTTWLVWRTPDVHAFAKHTAPVTTTDILDFRKFGDPELDQFILNLRQRKVSLETREKALQSLEARVQTEQQELSRLLKEVEKRQKDFDQVVTRVREEEAPQLKKLAKIFTTMTPATATSVLKEMTDDELLKLMSFMKESELTPLMEMLATRGPTEVRRVALLSQRLRLVLPPPTTTKP